MNLAQVRGVFTCLLLTLTATTSAQERYIEGVHYKRLPEASVQSNTDDVASVLEVFWYGCGSCYAFDPLLNSWVAEKGDRIAFERSPMVWDANTKKHARLFFATRILGLHEKMHGRIFDEIHKEGNYLLDIEAMAALTGEYGVDKAALDTTLASFGLDAEVRKAETRQRDMAILSVPALVVDGTYLINVTDKVPSHQAMLDVADFLLNKREGQHRPLSY
jgi:protein dithiol oxidoreductase (disulfide-forming)